MVVIDAASADFDHTLIGRLRRFSQRPGGSVPRVLLPALCGPSFPPWTTALRRSVAD
jgi:hypothetical protein